MFREDLFQGEVFWVFVLRRQPTTNSLLLRRHQINQIPILLKPIICVNHLLALFFAFGVGSGPELRLRILIHLTRIYHFLAVWGALAIFYLGIYVLENLLPKLIHRLLIINPRIFVTLWRFFSRIHALSLVDICGFYFKTRIFTFIKFTERLPPELHAGIRRAATLIHISLAYGTPKMLILNPRLAARGPTATTTWVVEVTHLADSARQYGLIYLFFCVTIWDRGEGEAAVEVVHVLPCIQLPAAASTIAAPRRNRLTIPSLGF